MLVGCFIYLAVMSCKWQKDVKPDSGYGTRRWVIIAATILYWTGFHFVRIFATRVGEGTSSSNCALQSHHGSVEQETNSNSRS